MRARASASAHPPEAHQTLDGHVGIDVDHHEPGHAVPTGLDQERDVEDHDSIAAPLGLHCAGDLRADGGMDDRR